MLRSGHHLMALSTRICLLALCVLLVPVAGAMGANERSLPTVQNPARIAGAVPLRAVPRPKRQAVDARPARRAARRRGDRRAVPLRRQLAEWVRLLRARGVCVREARNQLPHNAAAQYSYGRSIDRAKLKPGDLVFFHGLGHVGLYIGRGRIIHAPQSGERVEIQSLAARSGSVEGARRLDPAARARPQPPPTARSVRRVSRTYPTLLDLVGSTPIVRLDRFGATVRRRCSPSSSSSTRAARTRTASGSR